MKALITGGTGSLGQALVARWNEIVELTVLSRDPHKQAELAARYPSTRFILADINNIAEVERACRGQDILIHAAALKDVSTGEYHPSEFARVNVQGSLSVCRAWANTHQYQEGLALLISTDKAVNALNMYGATKKVAEAIFRKQDFSVLRYGNVVSSNGAFIYKWRAAVANQQPIVVRRGTVDQYPTRFFLTLEHALDLIDDAIAIAGQYGNGIFIPRQLKAFSIMDAADAFMRSTTMPGRHPVSVQHAPLLPYEKLHERLLAEGENASPVSDLLCKVSPGWGLSQEFESYHAPRLTGAEVLTYLEGGENVI